MGLLGKALGGLTSNLKDKISQGIQGAKRFAGNVWDTAKQGLTQAKDFVVNNREAIGGALKAISPFVTAINPVLGVAASKGGSFLQKLKPGPVKDKLTTLAHKSYDEPTSSKAVTMDSGVQQAVERKRVRKKAKLSTQE